MKNLFSLSTVSIDCGLSDSNVESRIKRELFCKGYDETVRPVKNHRTTTTINVKMMVKSYDYVSIFHIFDVWKSLKDIHISEERSLFDAHS